MEHLITESMGPGSELLPIATQQLSQVRHKSYHWSFLYPTLLYFTLLYFTLLYLLLHSHVRKMHQWGIWWLDIWATNSFLYKRGWSVSYLSSIIRNHSVFLALLLLQCFVFFNVERDSFVTSADDNVVMLYCPTWPSLLLNSRVILLSISHRF